MEELAERFDEVLTGVNMNRFEPQRPEERIAIGCLTTRKLFVGLAIDAAERVEHYHLASLCVAKPDHSDGWHRKFALIGDDERYDVVLAARYFERTLVAGVLKIAD